MAVSKPLLSEFVISHRLESSALPNTATILRVSEYLSVPPRPLSYHTRNQQPINSVPMSKKYRVVAHMSSLE